MSKAKQADLAEWNENEVMMEKFTLKHPFEDDFIIPQDIQNAGYKELKRFSDIASMATYITTGNTTNNINAAHGSTSIDAAKSNSTNITTSNSTIISKNGNADITTSTAAITAQATSAPAEDELEIVKRIRDGFAILKECGDNLDGIVYPKRVRICLYLLKIRRTKSRESLLKVDYFI